MALLRSRKYKVLLGLLISLAFLYWVYRAADWAEVGRIMTRIELWPIIPVILVMALHFVLRALRWRYLLPDGRNLPLRLSLDSMMAGNYANFILPLRAGEFIRAWFLASRTSYSFPQAFVSVVIERFFDLATVLLLFAIVLLNRPGLPDLATGGATALTIVAGLLLLFIICAGTLPKQIRAMTTRLLRVSERVGVPQYLTNTGEKILDDLLRGVAVLKSPLDLILVFIYSALVWASAVLSYFIFFWFFDIQTSVEFAVAVTVLIALSVAAPSAPGFIGVFQFGGIWAFKLYGLDQNQGTAYSLFAHAVTYVFIVSYGTYLLFAYRLSLRRLRDVAETEETVQPEPARP